MFQVTFHSFNTTSFPLFKPRRRHKPAERHESFVPKQDLSSSTPDLRIESAIIQSALTVTLLFLGYA